MAGWVRRGLVGGRVGCAARMRGSDVGLWAHMRREGCIAARSRSLLRVAVVCPVRPFRPRACATVIARRPAVLPCLSPWGPPLPFRACAAGLSAVPTDATRTRTHARIGSDRSPPPVPAATEGWGEVQRSGPTHAHAHTTLTRSRTGQHVPISVRLPALLARSDT